MKAWPLLVKVQTSNSNVVSTDSIVQGREFVGVRVQEHANWFRSTICRYLSVSAASGGTRAKLEYTALAAKICTLYPPRRSTIAQLRSVYEAAWRTLLAPANFQRNVQKSGAFGKRDTTARPSFRPRRGRCSGPSVSRSLPHRRRCALGSGARQTTAVEAASGGRRVSVASGFERSRHYAGSRRGQ